MLELLGDGTEWRAISALSIKAIAGDCAMVAVAYGYRPRNSFSPHHRDAWGGLVAVAESQRGKRLGSYINAKMITRLFSELGAARIYQLVSEANAASRKMVEACGLRLDPTVKSGSAVAGGDRFTR